MGFTSRLFLSLTFVLVPSLALSIPLVLPAPRPAEKPAADPTSNRNADEEGLDIGEPELGHIRPGLLLDSDDFHNFLHLSTGVVIGETGHFLLGIALQQKQRIVHTWTYGLEAYLSESIFFYGGYGYLLGKWKTLRPELLLDFGVRAFPEEALATLIKTDNFYVRSGLALNYHWNAGNSLRFEFKYAQGLSQNFSSFHGGYVWVWR